MRWRRWLAGAALLGIGGAAATVGGLAWLSYRWEQGVRWWLAEQTGGEVTFEALSVSPGGVVVTGVVVTDGATELARVGELRVAARPWRWRDPGVVRVDRIAASDVHVVATWADGAWTRPPVTWALLGRGVEATTGAPLPSVTAPEVTVDRLTVAVRGGEVAVDRLVWRDAVAAWSPGLVLRGAALEAGPVEVRAGDTLTVAAIDGRLDDLAVGSARVGGELTAHTVTVDVAGPGWTLPELRAAFGDLVVDTELVVDGFEARHAGVQATAAGFTTRATTSADGVAFEPIAARDVALVGADGPLLRASSLDTGPGRIDAGMSTTRVALGGAESRARWGADRLGVPDAAFALARLGGPLTVDVVTFAGTPQTVVAPSGTLTVRPGDVALRGVRLGDPTWSVAAGTVDGVTLAWTDRELTVDAVAFDADGHLVVAGGRWDTRLDAPRQVAWPPVAADLAPDWLGGSNPDPARFYGVAFPGWPWVPARLDATDVAVHLTEATTGAEVPWDVVLTVASVGPAEPTRVPVSVDGLVAGGTFHVAGTLDHAGEWRLHAAVADVDLAPLRPYVDERLRKIGWELVEGTGAAEVDVVLAGSIVSVRGRAHGDELLWRAVGVTKVVADRTRAAPPRRMSFPVDVAGDLTDPEFSVQQQLVKAFVREVTADVGDALHVGDVVRAGQAVATKADAVAADVKEVAADAKAGVDKATGAVKEKVEAGADRVKRAVDKLGDKLEKKGDDGDEATDEVP